MTPLSLFLAESSRYLLGALALGVLYLGITRQERRGR